MLIGLIGHVFQRERPADFKVSGTENGTRIIVTASLTCAITSNLKVVGNCSNHHLEGPEHTVAVALQAAQLVLTSSTHPPGF